MAKVTAFTGFLLLLAITVFGQQDPPASSKDALRAQPELTENNVKQRTREDRKKAKSPTVNTAFSHIENLKNGVLFIRLRTSENAIKSLEKAGNSAMANTVRKRQEAENKRLTAAFRQHFTFCPVYFFFSTYSEDIRNGNFSGTFVNENLEKTSGPVLSNNNFYIAEVTELEQYRSDPENPNSSNNAEISFKALVIRDNNFHQLSKPFPYFVKASQNIPPRKRSEAELVSLLNEKLNAYYSYALKKR